MKVVSINEWKDLKEIKRSEESYKRYLSTLANSQLEIEVNALLEEFSGDSYGKDFFAKGQLFVFRFRFPDSLSQAYFWARSARGDRIPGQRKSFATRSRDNLGFIFSQTCFFVTSVA